jgi:hypothetical protein
MSTERTMWRPAPSTAARNRMVKPPTCFQSRRARPTATPLNQQEHAGGRLSKGLKRIAAPNSCGDRVATEAGRP